MDTIKSFKCCGADPDLTLRKVAIWMSKNSKKNWKNVQKNCQKLSFFSKNCQKLSFFFQKIANGNFLEKKDNFWQFFEKKCQRFWQFFDSQMTIFRRVWSLGGNLIYCTSEKCSYLEYTTFEHSSPTLFHNWLKRFQSASTDISA